MANIVLTGAHGFIGVNILEQILKSTFEEIWCWRNPIVCLIQVCCYCKHGFVEGVFVLNNMLFKDIRVEYNAFVDEVHFESFLLWRQQTMLGNMRLENKQNSNKSNNDERRQPHNVVVFAQCIAEGWTYTPWSCQENYV